MSYMLDCPECGNKPRLALDKETEWYSVDCEYYGCMFGGSRGSYRHDVDTAVCDWDEQVIENLFTVGDDAAAKEHLEELDKYPAWREHVESGEGRGDYPL